ncbi:MAG TPA: copper homeostasis protein CutC [Rhodanobacteraceae bacterium]
MLEIAANSVASAQAAKAGGADRVELCTALEVGGLTPSHGLLLQTREQVGLPIHVLIRPRAGDFLYNDDEIATMLHDIRTCKALGCAGVVIGALTADGDVDHVRCRALIAAADGMDVTFHRAIDVARDPHAALEDIIALGCRRVLTSGAQPSALAGAHAIRTLIGQAAGRIEVMPGGGVAAANLAELAASTGARQFHASAKAVLPSGMHHARGVLPDMESGEWRTNIARVRALADVLAATCAD